MKRSGFTMIELIFVIVILGILASVAIPKLAATRTDAQIAGKLSEISTLKKDLSAYYTSQGTFTAAAITDATNIKLRADGACGTNATAIASGSTYSFCVESVGGTDEVLFDITLTNTDGNITFSSTTGGTGDIASAIESMDQYTNLMTSVEVGGSQVKF